MYYLRAKEHTNNDILPLNC